MTNKKWVTVFGVLIALFAIALPLVIIFTTYMSLETTTSKMALNIVGVFLSLGIVLGAIKLFKRRIKLKKETGFAVSPYYIMFSYGFGPVCFTWLFWWFLNTIQNDIIELTKVMLLIGICETIAFVFKMVQVHFDIKVLKEQQE